MSWEINSRKNAMDMRRLMLSVVFLSVCINSYAQNLEAIMRLEGVAVPEEVDSYEVERLQDLMRNPIDINAAGAGRLQECGLFSSFQTAAILDYRSRHGAIMSLAELAALDGFTTSVTEVLAPFVVLGESIREEKNSWSCEGAMRGGFKSEESEDPSWTYGIKCRAGFSDAVSTSLSVTCPYDELSARPSLLSGNFLWRYSYGKVLVGDFNARFGQGLGLWNTMTYGGLSSPSAFMKKPSGISASYSFTGTSALTGIAADCILGRWKISSLIALPGIKDVKKHPEKLLLQPVVNIMRIGTYGHFSITQSVSFSNLKGRNFRIPQMRTSVDVSYCLRGVNLFGEFAFECVEPCVAFVVGTDFRTEKYLRHATLLRYNPFANEHGLAYSGEYQRKRHRVTYAVDCLYHPESKVKDGSVCCQAKAQIDWSLDFYEGFSLRMRLVERFRTWGVACRSDIRADVGYKSGRWVADIRVNMVNGVGTGILGYLEGGYVMDGLSAYVRYGMFASDNWNDRIYVYERDAPGGFNVPAYHGRGLWGAAYVSWKFCRWGRIYVRASLISYPFMRGDEKKPGRAELRVQTVFRL